jgi:hypothetical protein
MEKLDKNGNTKSNGIVGKALENDVERKERFLSLYIVYFTLFLQSLGLAIAMTGVWPYLSRVSCFFINVFVNLCRKLFCTTFILKIISS